MRKARTIALSISGTAALITIAAGCGGPSVTKASSPPSPTAAPYSQPATPASTPSAVTSGPVGTTFSVTGTDNSGNATAYNVTLVRVIQHAAPDNSFDAAPSGQHLAAAEFRITGVTGDSSDDANSDAGANGTDEQVYQPEFGGLAAGTNFNGGDFNVNAGQTSIGWVAFQLPDGITVASVQWTPGIDGSSATWTVKS
jgi:hypothetical protein